MLLKHRKMKSRITIDLDEDNMPCIKIVYQESDDVRDAMVKRFMQHIPYEANGLPYRYHQHESWQPNSRMTIRPKEFTSREGHT